MENHGQRILNYLDTLLLDKHNIYHLVDTPLGVGFCLKLEYTTQNFMSIIYNESSRLYTVKLMRITHKGIMKNTKKFEIEDVEDIWPIFNFKQFTYANDKIIKVGETFQINGGREVWDVIFDPEANALKFRESAENVQKQNVRKGSYYGAYYFNDSTVYARNKNGRRSTI